jgi:hypothetical protein
MEEGGGAFPKRLGRLPSSFQGTDIDIQGLENSPMGASFKPSGMNEQFGTAPRRLGRPSFGQGHSTVPDGSLNRLAETSVKQPRVPHNVQPFVKMNPQVRPKSSEVAQQPSAGGPSNINRDGPPRRKMSQGSRQEIPRLGGTGNIGQGWNTRILPPARENMQETGQRGPGMTTQHQQKQNPRNVVLPTGQNRPRNGMSHSAASGSGISHLSVPGGYTTEVSTSAVSPFPPKATTGMDDHQRSDSSLPSEYHGTAEYDDELNMHIDHGNHFEGSDDTRDKDSRRISLDQGKELEHPYVEGGNGHRTIELENDDDGLQAPRRISMDNFREHAQGTSFEDGGALGAAGMVEETAMSTRLMDMDVETEQADSASPFDSRRVSTENYYNGESMMEFDQLGDPGTFMDQNRPYGYGNEHEYDAVMGDDDGNYEMLVPEEVWSGKSFEDLKQMFLEWNEETADLQMELGKDLLSASVEMTYIYTQLLAQQAVVFADLVDEAEALEDESDDYIFRFQQRFVEYEEIKNREIEEEEALRQHEEMNRLARVAMNIDEEAEKESGNLEQDGKAIENNHTDEQFRDDKNHQENGSEANKMSESVAGMENDGEDIETEQSDIEQHAMFVGEKDMETENSDKEQDIVLAESPTDEMNVEKEAPTMLAYLVKAAVIHRHGATIDTIQNEKTEVGKEIPETPPVAKIPLNNDPEAMSEGGATPATAAYEGSREKEIDSTPTPPPATSEEGNEGTGLDMEATSEEAKFVEEFETMLAQVPVIEAEKSPIVTVANTALAPIVKPSSGKNCREILEKEQEAAAVGSKEVASIAIEESQDATVAKEEKANEVKM